MITILLVDDHPVVRHGMRALLDTQDDLTVVAEASGLADTGTAVQSHEIDVALVDLDLGAGEPDGIEVTRAIRRLRPEARVIVFTAYDSDADIVRAVEAGATGYLVKDSRPAEVFQAIRAAASGRRAMTGRINERLLRRAGRSDETLTSRELEVLSLAAACSSAAADQPVAASSAAAVTSVADQATSAEPEASTEATTESPAEPTQTPSEVLSSTAWETTDATDQDGNHVALDDKNVANYVGWAYYPADGTFTMYNLDDTPKMQGDWTVNADGTERTLVAKDATGKELFTRVVPITELTANQFTYRVYPTEGDTATYFDIIHTPTDHAEPAA